MVDEDYREGAKENNKQNLVLHFFASSRLRGRLYWEHQMQRK
jgi:hypothetical protein